MKEIPLNLSRPPRVVVIGSHDSGKTTFRTQLIQRLNHRPGKLRLARSIEDLSAIGSDLERLNQGLQPLHTTASVYQSTTVPIHDGKREHSLEFPDYGGEQIDNIARTHFVSEKWESVILEATSWMLFLRIDRLRRARDSFASPVATLSPNQASKNSPVQSLLEIDSIELIQRLLFLAGVSPRNKLLWPRLAVILSCWDEVPEAQAGKLPKDVLRLRAPLLAAYLESNWAIESQRTWGLSSTEGALPMDSPNHDFAKKGPENFGYVVGNNGERDPDLTRPLSWLVESHE